MDRCALPVVCALLGVLAPCSLCAGEPVSFRNDVMAVLSRAGCNMGACHGNLNGKGGFKLSLRGQDPDADFATLTRDSLGRRIDRLRPDASLVLAKATMTIPHEGGQRFRRDSQEFRLLRSWIAAGARPDPAGSPTAVEINVTPRSAVLHAPRGNVQLKVVANFSNGKQRDVTRLACFEPSNLLVKVDGTGLAVRAAGYGESAVLVRYLDRQAVVQLAFVPARPGFVWKDIPENNYIDRHVFAKLKTLRMQPSSLCSDSAFLRRAYLDAIGVLPTPAESRRFLEDRRSDKRSRLIDALLRRNEFADFWALKWSDLLRNEEKALDRRGVRAFHAWIRRAIIDGKPLNEFARDLVASRGSTYKNPASNYYRALREPYARAEATAQVFLGLRLQCARCHNHPFDRWTQTDYHQLAAFFVRVQYRILENNRKDRLDKHEFAGEQIVYQSRSGELLHPVSGAVLQPRFPGADTPELGPTSDRLTALADWIARPDNPFFARAQVNRIWQHLLGRGIVDPGDDFRDSNPPVNPALLDALARDFVSSRFNLKHLVRTIMNSRTYQLSARPTATNTDDESNFARALIRPLQAEQLFDAAAQVSGVRPRFEGFPGGTRAGQLPGVGGPQRRRGQGEAARFLAVFGKPVRLLSCECERSDDATLARAFQLITGGVLQRMLSEPNNRIGQALAKGASIQAIIEELYLAALCRLPSGEERRQLVSFVERAKDRRSALEDVLWGLLNAKEFLLRR
jgi:hypothetical protein